MPRKSAAAKKDTAVADAKSEGGAPRRSGRAVTKHESNPGKDATRSRRSSTAAQTAASVADSKSPKSRNSVSSRRDSSSPADSRGRSGKESGVESPATRVKSTRRNASRINYKESDGEEDVSTPKNDDNFNSDEEFDDTESDEKSKPKGKSKPVKSPAKGKSPKDHSKVVGGRGRRGRPAKKKNYDDEDSDAEAFDVSEDSVEIDSPKSGRKKGKSPPAKDSEVSSKRGRKGKVTTEVTKEKGKPARRSSRAVTSKDDTPKKRPSRSLQAKRYTEEEDDEEEVEELSDSKPEDEDNEAKPVSEGSRKRKRSSISEPNKRKKEETTSENEQPKEEKDDNASEKKPETDSIDEEKESEDKASDTKEEEDAEKDSEEPMDVDESDSITTDEKPSQKEKESSEKKEVPESAEKKADSKNEHSITSKGNISTSATKGSIDSSENMDESASDSDQGSRADQSISSGLDDSQESQEAKREVKAKVNPSANCEQVKKQIDTDSASQSSESLGKTDDTKSSQPVETQGNSTTAKSADKAPESSKQDSNKDTSSETNVNLSSSVGSSPSSNILHSKEQNSDASFNGAERTAAAISNTTHVIHPASSVIFEHKEIPAPKANGAHDGLHNSATLSDDQHYPFPGRKFTFNSKMSEIFRKSIKDKTFAFLSYNLGVSGPDVFVQKDKLLHELDKLQSQIICLQQVAKPFYNDVLEPSLDALGFKGVFSQPEESLKGMATFYKTTLFRLSCLSEASLKKSIEKDLEASSMDTSDKIAVKAHLKKCGSVLFTRFTSVIGDHAVTVANVQIPTSDLSIHALQVSCLAREVVTMAGGANKPLLLCGEFNMAEGEAPYQLLRDGYLSNDMIEELQRRKDVVLPGKENAALINLLWKAFQHPSSNLCSCYATVLDHELFIPEKKATSPDLLWYSRDSLHTVGVLDAISDKPGDCRFSLKADIAFSV